LPIHKANELKKLNTVIKMLGKGGQILTERDKFELSAYLGWPVSKIHEILLLGEPVSLDACGADDNADKATALVNILEDDKYALPEEQAIAQDTQDAVWAVLAKLSSRERQIMIYRYGLIDGDAKTLEETGAKLDISKERVRQIQERAEKKMRSLMRDAETGGQLPKRAEKETGSRKERHGLGCYLPSNNKNVTQKAFYGLEGWLTMLKCSPRAYPPRNQRLPK